MLIPCRLHILAKFSYIAACVIALAGCGSVIRDPISGTIIADFRDSPEERLRLAAELAETTEERNNLWDAMNREWQEAARLDQDLKIKQGEAEAAQQRLDGAEKARQRNERTWMFAMFAVGILFLLAAGGLFIFGKKLLVPHTGKAAVVVGALGACMILIAPDARGFGMPIKILLYTLVIGVAGGVVIWMLNNINWERLQRRAPALEGG